MKPVICAILWLAVTAATARGQCELAGYSVDPDNPVVETAGGISYLRFSYESACPQELWKSAPTVDGTNVNQSIFLVDGPQFCPPIFPPPVYDRNASLVLGKFNPGNYLCRIFTTLSFGGGLWMTAQIPFTVPQPQPTLTLVSVRPTQVVLRVNGVPDVTYRVQSSSNLTNWATFHTQVGAPFTITNAPSTNTFYRVQISDEVPVCP